MFRSMGWQEMVICGVMLAPLIVGAVLIPILSRRTRAEGQEFSPAANWYADPTGRHELRYWDGIKWTVWVSDAGVQSEDPGR